MGFTRPAIQTHPLPDVHTVLPSLFAPHGCGAALFSLSPPECKACDLCNREREEICTFPLEMDLKRGERTVNIRYGALGSQPNQAPAFCNIREKIKPLLLSRYYFPSRSMIGRFPMAPVSMCR